MSDSTIGGSVVIALVLFMFIYTSLDWPEYFNYKTRARYNEKRKCINRKPEGSVFYADDAERDCHEHYHREQEKIYWSAYISISTFTFIAACVAAYYASGAYNQAKRQADAAEAANAPFVGFVGVNITTIGQKSIFRPEWLNSGNAPAVDAWSKTDCEITKKEIVEFSKPTNFKYKSSANPRIPYFGGACNIPLVLDAQTILNIDNRKIYFSIGGTVCYKELGRTEWHVTEFFQEIAAVFNSAGIDLVETGNHNCVDHNCPDYATICPE